MRDQQLERMRQHQEQMRQQHQQAQEQARQHREQARQQHEQARQQHEQQMEQIRQQAEQARQQAINSSVTYASHSMPGYWPDEKHEHSIPVTSQDDDQIPPSGAAAAKYRSIMGLETSIEQQLAAAEKAAPGPEKEALEWAIAEMLNQMEVMRMEADEDGG